MALWNQPGALTSSQAAAVGMTSGACLSPMGAGPQGSTPHGASFSRGAEAFLPGMQMPLGPARLSWEAPALQQPEVLLILPHTAGAGAPSSPVCVCVSSASRPGWRPTLCTPEQLPPGPSRLQCAVPGAQPGP